MRIPSVLTLVCFFNPAVHSCDCKSYSSYAQARSVSYAYSDFVFIGQVSQVEQKLNVATLSVIEVFKGFIPSKVTVAFRSSCSYTPERFFEKWLVFANVIEDGGLELSLCSSKSLDNIQPPLNVNLDFPDSIKVHFIGEGLSGYWYTLRHEANVELMKDIEWLREKRPIWESDHPLDDITGRYPDYGLSEL